MQSQQRDTGTFRAVPVQRGGFVDETGTPAVDPQKKGPQPMVEVPLQEESKSGPFRSYFFIGALIFIICALVILLLVMWLGLGLENESARLGESALAMLLVG
ncbi:hypothetical protein [Corynebacterium evansiae]|uniref:hypothetical protein n=1 Tax=Corynebacterium evansiae TaxID=2913499 RepID=UPI003EC130D3